jgi:hypothetical protein
LQEIVVLPGTNQEPKDVLEVMTMRNSRKPPTNVGAFSVAEELEEEEDEPVEPAPLDAPRQNQVPKPL